MTEDKILEYLRSGSPVANVHPYGSKSTQGIEIVKVLSIRKSQTKDGLIVRVQLPNEIDAISVKPEYLFEISDPLVDKYFKAEKILEDILGELAGKIHPPNRVED